MLRIISSRMQRLRKVRRRPVDLRREVAQLRDRVVLVITSSSSFLCALENSGSSSAIAASNSGSYSVVRFFDSFSSYRLLLLELRKPFFAPSKAFDGGAGGFSFFDGSGGACVERWCRENCLRSLTRRVDSLTATPRRRRRS